jgi:autotransporter-associated beta strand protein
MCNTGGTLLYASSANQSYAWIISGAGGIFMNGTASNTLALTGNNSFTGSTTINSGTLKAGAADALGDTSEVNIDGGSLLIAASEAINDAAAIDLNGGRIEFEGNVTEHLGVFTLSANSTIDMGMGTVWLQFSGLSAQMAFDLKIYNYTLYSDYLYFVNVPNVSESLSHIRFYSGTDESSFIGNSFIENSFGPSPYNVRPVPEPETYATAALLLLGLGIYAYRRRKAKWNENLEGRSSAGNCGPAATMHLGKGL